MSGMRKFIYTNKRIRPLEEWEDFSCKTLDFIVKIISIAILLFFIGLILKCLL